MKSANASLHLIARNRQVLPAADLDAALAEASEKQVPLEDVLRARGVAASQIDQLAKVRARHGYPCASCRKLTFLLPGDARERKPCEHCGGKLAAQGAPPAAPKVAAPRPDAASPPGARPLASSAAPAAPDGKPVASPAATAASPAAPAPRPLASPAAAAPAAPEPAAPEPAPSAAASEPVPSAAASEPVPNASEPAPGTREKPALERVRPPAGATGRPSSRFGSVATSAPPGAKLGDAPRASDLAPDAVRGRTFAPPVAARLPERPAPASRGFPIPIPVRLIGPAIVLLLFFANDRLFGSRSAPPPSMEPTKEWTVAPDLELDAELSPSPVRAVPTTLTVRSIAEGDACRGDASYRLVAKPDGPGAWKPLDAVELQDAPHLAAWSAKLPLEPGKAHLQLRCPTRAEGEPQVFDWELDVLDASGRPPGHGELWTWARWAAIVLFSLYGLAPLIVKFTTTQPARADLVPVEQALLPDEVAGYLVPRANALEPLGFERAGVLALDVQNGRFYLARLQNPAASDSAFVSVLVAPNGQTKAKSVGFVSRFATGGSCETSNSRTYSNVFPRPANKKVMHVHEDTLEKLYRIHQGLAREVGRGAKHVLPEPGKELEQVAKNIVEPVEYAASQGYFALDAAAGVWRPTLQGAFLMTWRLLPPAKQLGQLARSKEEARLRAAYGA